MQRVRLDEVVRSALAAHTKLSCVEAIGPDEDLFRLGLDSHAVVALMLALEDSLGVEFPEERLTRATFATISAIVQALPVPALAA